MFDGHNAMVGMKHYSLTAPIVSPCIIYFCRKYTITKTISVVITTVAIAGPHMFPDAPVPVLPENAIAMVGRVRVLAWVNMVAAKSSCQQKRNTKIRLVEIPGLDIGTII